MDFKNAIETIKGKFGSPIVTVSTAIVPRENGKFTVFIGWQRSDSQVIVAIYYTSYDDEQNPELVIAGNVMENENGEPMTATREELEKYKMVITEAIIKVLLPKLQEFLRETGKETFVEIVEDSTDERIAS